MEGNPRKQREGSLVVEVCGIPYVSEGERKLAIGYGMRGEGEVGYIESGFVGRIDDSKIPVPYTPGDDNAARRLSQIIKRRVRGTEAVRLTGGLHAKTAVPIPEERQFLDITVKALKIEGVIAVAE